MCLKQGGWVRPPGLRGVGPESEVFPGCLEHWKFEKPWPGFTDTWLSLLTAVLGAIGSQTCLGVPYMTMTYKTERFH